MEKKKVNYCGSGKTANNEGTWIRATINVDKIKDFIEEYNGNRFVKLNINIKSEDKYGKNVSISIDEFKPEPKTESKAVAEPLDDSLPF